MAELEDLAWTSPARARLAALRARGVHAALLHGPAGTGKWSLAMRFARDALCESPRPDASACGRCASCTLFAAGNHPDLRVVVPDAYAERRPTGESDIDEAPGAGDETPAGRAKPSREIKIDQVRELGALFGLSAHRGGARIVALGPAEALNAPAANALLKALEEPPPDSFFVLVSDQLDRCRPTVASRCVLVRVAPPRHAEALQWLQGKGLGPQEAQVRLTEAGGAPLAALGAGEEALGAELRAILVGLLRRGRDLSAAEIAEGVPRTVPIAPSVALFQRWVWDYFAFRTAGTLRYHPQEAKAFERLSASWSLPAAGEWADRLCSLKAVAAHPLNPRAAIEGILLDYLASVAPDAQAVAK